jgi:hypothetical protein
MIDDVCFVSLVWERRSEHQNEVGSLRARILQSLVVTFIFTRLSQVRSAVLP